MGTITRNFANNILSSGTIDATDGIDGAIPSSNIANASVTNITELPPAIEVIESVATDPVSPNEGEVWFNSTSAVLKLQSVTTAGAFASGGNLNTARYDIVAVGTQTATLGFSGNPNTGPGNPGGTDATESYNGTSWSPAPNMNTFLFERAGAGNQTAALGFGGRTYPQGTTSATESYNGSSWTTVNSMNTARRSGIGAGTQTAALSFGGQAPADITATETWNGTSWTTTPANTAPNTSHTFGGGTQTAAITAGGYPNVTTTQTYNGSAWTTVNNLNTGRLLNGFGTQTAAVGAGGYRTPVSPQTVVELWNGTSWTTNPNSMATGRFYAGGAGTQTAGLITGGAPVTAATEEWTGPGAPVTKTITVS